MTRLVCLAVVLLACAAWQCSADGEPEIISSDEQPPPRRSTRRHRGPVNYTGEDVNGALELAKDAQRHLLLATSADNLAKRRSTDPVEEATASRNRAMEAMGEAKKAAADAESSAKDTGSASAKKAALKAKMAAEIAQQLYGNVTAAPLLIDGHAKWFSERYGDANGLLPSLTKAVDALERRDGVEGISDLVKNVLTPARKIFKSAQDAENDAKYIAHKLFYSAMLAEVVGILRDIAVKAKNAATSGDEGSAEESCTDDGDDDERNSAMISAIRGGAVKAYVYALSANKTVTRCVTRVNKNMTQFEGAYKSVKELLEKSGKSKDKMTSIYQRITDDAYANIQESKQIIITASEEIQKFMNEAKAAKEAMTPCVKMGTAKTSAVAARAAFKKALKEVYLALYQLFSATMSLQQMLDVQKAVSASATRGRDAGAGDEPPVRSQGSEGPVESDATTDMGGDVLTPEPITIPQPQ